MRSAVVFAALALLTATAAQAQPTGRPEIVRVRYMVHDVPATVAFYSGKLGFRVDFQSGTYFAALSRGGVQLLVSPVNGPGGAPQPMPNGDRPAPGGWNRLVINTPDLSAEVARLKQAGVRFRNDIVYGLGGDEILLEDPSGNVVELFQPTTDLTAR